MVIKQEMFYVVSAFELEKLIDSEYKLNDKLFDIGKDQQLFPGDIVKLLVSRKKIGKRTLKHAKKMVSNRIYSYQITDLLLDDLCYKSVIPEGQYMIEI